MPGLPDSDSEFAFRALFAKTIAVLARWGERSGDMLGLAGSDSECGFRALFLNVCSACSVGGRGDMLGLRSASSARGGATCSGWRVQIPNLHFVHFSQSFAVLAR